MDDTTNSQNDEPDREEAHLARALAVARRGMRKYRDALKELAGLEAKRPPADDNA